MPSADQVPVKSSHLRDAKALMGCPDRRIDRLCITCCLPFPTFTSRRMPARSRLGRKSDRFPVALTSRHHRPRHAGDLIGERDGSDLGRPARQQCFEPGPVLGAMDLGIADDSKRTCREQAAQITIALLADTAELVPSAARMLLRHEPDPSREVSPRSECLWITDAGD